MFRFFKKKKEAEQPFSDEKEKEEEPVEKKNEPLVEGKHYYIENGCYVFTEYYLKERGYCCSNGCRHCPY